MTDAQEALLLAIGDQISSPARPPERYAEIMEALTAALWRVRAERKRRFDLVEARAIGTKGA